MWPHGKNRDHPLPSLFPPGWLHPMFSDTEVLMGEGRGAESSSRQFTSNLPSKPGLKLPSFQGLCEHQIDFSLSERSGKSSSSSNAVVLQGFVVVFVWIFFYNLLLHFSIFLLKCLAIYYARRLLCIVA